MKTTFKSGLLLFTLFIGTTLLLHSCKKHSVDPVPSPTPTPTPTPTPVPVVLKVTSFAPDSAAMDSTVTIHGSAFGNSTTGISVKFNGVTATVMAVNDSIVTAKVPIHAADGKISVQV